MHTNNANKPVEVARNRANPPTSSPKYDESAEARWRAETDARGRDLDALASADVQDALDALARERDETARPAPPRIAAGDNRQRRAKLPDVCFLDSDGWATGEGQLFATWDALDVMLGRPGGSAPPELTAAQIERFNTEIAAPAAEARRREGRSYPPRPTDRQQPAHAPDRAAHARPLRQDRPPGTNPTAPQAPSQGQDATNHARPLYFVEPGATPGTENEAGDGATVDIEPSEGVEASGNSVPTATQIKDLGHLDALTDAVSAPPQARSRSRRIAARITGERRTFDLMRLAHPGTVDVAFARLLIALAYPRQTSEDADGNAVALLPGPLLASCMGLETDYAEGNLRGDDSTGAFLDAFRDAVLPGLDVTEFVAGERVRTVRLDHVRSLINPDLLHLLDLDMATDPADFSDRVYLDNGAAFSSSVRGREHQRWQVAMAGVVESAPCDLSARLWRLLADAPMRRATAVWPHLDAAREAALTLESEQARTDATRDLRHVADYPYQWYQFSRFSTRLFTANPGVASLAAPVRRALLPDSYEVDLASAHLAIIAAEWKCAELFAVLDSGESFWPLILGHMGLDYTDASKAAVKRGTYGLVYGAGDERIVSDIRAEYRSWTGREMPAETALRFFDHPLVAEVKAARDAQLQAVREALSMTDDSGRFVGYVVDCFGRQLRVGQMEYGDGVKRTVHGPDAARSILSQITQAREMQLMAPIIALAEEQHAKGRGADWWITCWSHDGFNVKFRRRPETYLAELQAAVAHQADELGIPTRLEVKYRPE